MLELHGRLSGAVLLELLHDEIASPNLLNTFVLCP